MTKLIHASGNLIDMAEQGLFNVIVHGCNCQVTMGSGIAREIRERHPSAYQADIDFDKPSHHRISKLGNYSSTVIDSDRYMFTIINAYTQYQFFPRGIDHFDYESFALILRKLSHVYPGYRFGFPYIGCGLAGGNKELIVAMLEDFAETVSAQHGKVTLVEFE
jgi:O-acetyl-ADP-ribose deacetylase (regulator of RNase III)